MARFYKHRYRLTFLVEAPDAIAIPVSPDRSVIVTDLQIKGSIKADKSSGNNVLAMQVNNLSESSIDKIAQENLQIKLEVAYPDEDFKDLFNGTLITMEAKNPGNGSLTTFKAIDSYSELRDAQTNRTWNGKPTTAKTIIEDIVTLDMNLAVGDIHNNTNIGPVFELPTGTGIDTPFFSYSAVGGSVEVMDDFCDGLELEWNITDGKVNVYPKGQGKRKRDLIPLFSPTTGLVETPSKVIINPDRAKSSNDKKTGKKFKVILSPTLRVGDTVKIESKNINEQVTVSSLSHDFNYYKGSWFTNIVAEDQS